MVVLVIPPYASEISGFLFLTIGLIHYRLHKEQSFYLFNLYNIKFHQIVTKIN